ncbi:MAG: serine hydrolase domain-containing protein, partial [Isosphaeraceae bacterium]
MIGRRDWLWRSTRGLAAWAVTGATCVHETFGQTTPSRKRTSRKFTARRPVSPDAGKGTATPGSSNANVRADERLNRLLEPIRGDHHLPGLIGAVVRGDRLAAIGAAGVRKLGASDPIQVQDQVHIGSCTKAMTATLIGMLVDDGRLSWQSTIAQVFPDVAPRLHPAFQTVTLSHLLTHRAGLPHDARWWALPGISTTDQRRAALLELLSKPPLTKPGSTFAYSNAGYVFAGLMAEEATGQSWEKLMQDRLFRPLGMTTAGFGPPGRRDSGRVDQPWGHRENHGHIEPVWQDNAPCLGPAGTVHCSLPDWAKFVALHLRAAEGKPRLLKAATFRTLHTPPAGFEYAGGWGVVQRPWAGGIALSHSGSNTFWYATVWIAPARDFATLVATNQGPAPADTACDKTSQELIKFAT